MRSQISSLQDLDITIFKNHNYLRYLLMMGLSGGFKIDVSANGIGLLC